MPSRIFTTPAAPALLASLVRESREAAGARNIVVCAEDYLQRTPLIGGAGTGGAGIDQLWNDDFHHACRAALTGNHYGFFKNYRGHSPGAIVEFETRIFVPRTV